MAMGTSDTNGLGELLKRARECRGLTLEQVSSETKIPYRHLEALEHADMTAVHGEFYRRAEIRAYARAVGLDQKIVLGELERATTTPVTSAVIMEDSKAQHREPFHKRVLIAITVVLAAGVLGRGMSERGPAVETDLQRSHVSRPPVPQPASREPAVVAIEAPAVAVPSDSTSHPIEATRPTEPRRSADAIAELVISTQPAGARVTVNGIGWGFSPVTIRYLPPGQKRIRVTKEGYVAEERTVQFDEGQPNTVDIQLRTP